MAYHVDINGAQVKHLVHTPVKATIDVVVVPK